MSDEYVLFFKFLMASSDKKYWIFNLKSVEKAVLDIKKNMDAATEDGYFDKCLEDGINDHPLASMDQNQVLCVYSLINSLKNNGDDHEETSVYLQN